ncbi:MAG: UTP--glucose-1-phosphate uridylyltransferase [Spirochaetia bacterium]|nr:UTP--glucose-1-phosphate uridylyltransferase [Spirochaetia bacterium]
MSDYAVIQNEIMKRMLGQSMGPDIIREFMRRVDLVFRGDTGKIPWEEILDMRPDDSVSLANLPASDPAKTVEQLKQLAVVKLNGGLGTSMGLTRAKSVIPVHGGKNFLGIIREQIDLERSRGDALLPLIFMNSFNTEDDFNADPSMKDLNPDKTPSYFLQNMVPRLADRDMMPIGDGSKEDHWCPPGHGDVFLSLQTSGLLTRLLDAGRRVAFISNGDNLGATLDDRILNFFLESKLEFAMETTPKSAADLKGGVLFRRRGRHNISLLETAQVEPEHLKDFEDVKRFGFFSINNLWVHLEVLRDKLKSGLSLSLIVNPKEWQGQPILQLEAAMGSACESFSSMKVIEVARDRFAPVKNCSDLLVRRSDACKLRPRDLALILDEKRNHKEPVVRLGDEYKKIGDFDRLFPVYPSLLDAETVTVSGPVLFDAPLRIIGNVKIENRTSNPIAVSTIGRDTLKNEEIILQ